MKFEVVNDKEKIVFITNEVSCIPDKSEINSMIKAGYKFKLNGKFITKKKLKEVENIIM